MDRIIKTPRLELKALNDSDRERLIEIFRNDTVKKTYMLPDLDDTEKAEAIFLRMMELSQKSDRYVFGVYLDGVLIGIMNDTEICREYVEMGYAFDPAYFNRGFATEAFSAVIKFLFENGVEEVIAGAFSENAASLRVMEKCGMRCIDRTESIEYRGKEHLCLYYSIKRIV